MKKLLLVGMVSLLALSACKDDEPREPNFLMFPSKVCLNGVVYYSYNHGIAPAYKRDGTLLLCEVKEDR